MTASAIGYSNVLGWVKTRLLGTHVTVVRTAAWVVLCILVAQRVTPAALARAIPAEESGSGRTRLRRVGRWGQGAGGGAPNWAGGGSRRGCFDPRGGGDRRVTWWGGR